MFYVYQIKLKIICIYPGESTGDIYMERRFSIILNNPSNALHTLLKVAEQKSLNVLNFHLILKRDFS